MMPPALTVNTSCPFPSVNGNSSFILNSFCFPFSTVLPAASSALYLFRMKLWMTVYRSSVSSTPEMSYRAGVLITLTGRCLSFKP